MQISAVLLARSIALFDVADLNPRGKVFFPNLVPLLVNRFSFQVYPTKPEEFDASKGIAFKTGYFEGQAIEELTVFNDGIKLDLTSSTEEAKTLLTNMLEWLEAEVGIVYSNQTIKRWAFLSQITFHSDINLDGIHSAFGLLCNEVSSQVNARTGMNLQYKANSITFSFERVNSEISISNFIIERRAKTPFSENKYYSQAPLETRSHIRVLQELEENLVKSL